MGRKPLPKSRVQDAERKQAWAAELFEHFQAHGLRSLTMDQAAALLGVSKATLYTYFRSKEEILQAALAWKFQGIARFQVQLFNREIPYWERFTQAMRIAAEETTAIRTEFLAELRSAYPRVWEQVDAFIRESSDALRRFYADGIEAGALARVHPGIMVAADEAFFRYLAEPANLEREGLKLNEALSHYFALKYGGLFRETSVSAPERQALLNRLLADLPDDA
jgi:AcrR family transcriptional regulator